MSQIREVKHHHRKANNKMQRANLQGPQCHQEVHKPVQWHQNLSIKLKETMMMNGPLWSSLILNFLRNKNNLRKCVNNNSRKKSKKSSISKCKKKDAKNNVNKNKAKSILDFSNNKRSCMMKDKEKKKKNIKEKLNLRRKWETDKLRINIREKKLKKRRKINLITYWSLRLRKKYQ